MSGLTGTGKDAATGRDEVAVKFWRSNLARVRGELAHLERVATRAREQAEAAGVTHEEIAEVLAGVDGAK